MGIRKLCLVFVFIYGCKSDDYSVDEGLSEDVENTKEEFDSGSLAVEINSDFSISFLGDPGIYWYSRFVSDFGNVSGYSDAEKERHIVTNSNTLSVKLLKDEIGQSGGVICDIEIENSTEYILSYEVKFQDGFEWTKGGKLPGLGGGEVYAGGQDVSIGDGWSFRPVWHYYEGINNNQPFLAPYAYYVDQPSIFGNEFSKRFTITDDTWYHMWIHIKINTGTNNDGELHMKINNSTVYYNGSFRWVTEDNGREIDELMWDIFRGGVGSDYIASKDNLIYFDKFIIEKQ